MRGDENETVKKWFSFWSKFCWWISLLDRVNDRREREKEMTLPNRLRVVDETQNAEIESVDRYHTIRVQFVCWWRQQSFAVIYAFCLNRRYGRALIQAIQPSRHRHRHEQQHNENMQASPNEIEKYVQTQRNRIQFPALCPTKFTKIKKTFFFSLFWCRSIRIETKIGLNARSSSSSSSSSLNITIKTNEALKVRPVLYIFIVVYWIY